MSAAAASEAVVMPVWTLLPFRIPHFFQLPECWCLADYLPIIRVLSLL
jgi:hypothetical protein